jgi:hypothetical protein
VAQYKPLTDKPDSLNCSKEHQSEGGPSAQSHSPSPTITRLCQDDQVVQLEVNLLHNKGQLAKGHSGAAGQVHEAGTGQSLASEQEQQQGDRLNRVQGVVRVEQMRQLSLDYLLLRSMDR